MVKFACMICGLSKWTARASRRTCSDNCRQKLCRRKLWDELSAAIHAEVRALREQAHDHQADGHQADRERRTEGGGA